LIFAVLACVAEKWHHCGDAFCAGTAGGIHHDQQLHEVVVGGWAAWLDDENIRATDVFVDFYLSFPIGKS
jgi:hypothetical protein